MTSITKTNPAMDMLLLLCFAGLVLAAPIILQPLGLAYPDILQKFAIFSTSSLA